MAHSLILAQDHISFGSSIANINTDQLHPRPCKGGGFGGLSHGSQSGRTKTKVGQVDLSKYFQKLLMATGNTPAPKPVL